MRNLFILDNSENFNDTVCFALPAFIIQNQSNLHIRNCLNLIREGVILYQGIRYTSEVDELGKWDSNLVIYLNTEYLFNVLGYNGILFKEIFDDFFKLVSEINNLSLKEVNKKK